MTFNPNIPQSTDDPTQSQADLLSNNSAINTDFAVNHNPLTTGSSYGFHTEIQFPGVVSDPGASGNQSALYPKLSGGLPQLFFQNSSVIAQLTGLPIVTTTPGAVGFGFVTPWGFIINCGSLPAAAGGATVILQSPYTGGFTLYTAQLTQQSVTFVNVALISAVTTTTFTYQCGTGCYFFIMGK